MKVLRCFNTIIQCDIHRFKSALCHESHWVIWAGHTLSQKMCWVKIQIHFYLSASGSPIKVPRKTVVFCSPVSLVAWYVALILPQPSPWSCCWHCLKLSITLALPGTLIQAILADFLNKKQTELSDLRTKYIEAVNRRGGLRVAGNLTPCPRLRVQLSPGQLATSKVRGGCEWTGLWLAWGHANGPWPLLEQGPK